MEGQGIEEDTERGWLRSAQLVFGRIHHLVKKGHHTAINARKPPEGPRLLVCSFVRTSLHCTYMTRSSSKNDYYFFPSGGKNRTNQQHGETLTTTYDYVTGGETLHKLHTITCLWHAAAAAASGGGVGAYQQLPKSQESPTDEFPTSPSRPSE